MTNNENIKTLVINIEDEDFEGAYFIQDVMSIAKGVHEVEIVEYSEDGDSDYLDELNVIVKYDITLTNVDTLLNEIDKAEEELVTFYTDLMSKDLHLPQEDANELIKSLKGE